MSYCVMLDSWEHGASDLTRRGPAIWAAAAVGLLLLWQFLNVHYNRAGNWTALFLVGRDLPAPPELAGETYLFPGNGYDGEFYRYVAHDPFIQRGYVRYLDVPALRYRRILIPVLAYVLAIGRQNWIDASYIAVIALFVFLGAFWTGRWAALAGFSPAWGLAFLMVPATLISMDRMTVDVGVAAFAAGCAVFYSVGDRFKFLMVLVLACLVHEAGALLAVGACLFELAHRRFGRALLWACATLPMFAWLLWVRARIPEKTVITAPVGLARAAQTSLFYFLFHPPHYPLPSALEFIARSADLLSLAALLAAAVLAFFLLGRRPLSPIAITNALFAALILVMPFFWRHPDVWFDVNGYGRILSPLLILTAMLWAARENRALRPWIGLLPIACIDLRLGLQFSSAIAGVLRGLL
jgi:hypothetical protein